MKYYENDKMKGIVSEDYKCFFNKETGLMMRWGKTEDEDPKRAPAPEILDLEISTICEGIPDIGSTVNKVCRHCYKGASGKGVNMSFDTFKKILHKMPRNLTQIAFGIGSHNKCPDLWNIMDYCRNNDYNQVVPNITINGADLTDTDADQFAKYCGAVAVSRYANKDVCYDAVKKLTDRGMTQINIHVLISQETKEMCIDTMKDVMSDERLSKLNAVVFLILKKKGHAVNNYNRIDEQGFDEIIKFAIDNNIKYGTDSCNSSRLIDYYKRTNNPNLDKYMQLIEPCCGGRISSYIDVTGNYFVCSFMERQGEWNTGLNVLECDDFVKDIWNHPKVIQFGDKAVECSSCGIGCQFFEV